MIIVRLTGGLGNQLFEYAAARRLAHVNAAPLKLDLTHFGRNPDRTYALGHFNIQATIAAPKEVVWFGSREKVRRLKRWLYGCHPRPRWQWVVQRSLYFDATVLELHGNVYLDGVWQSEKYFSDAASLLHQELVVSSAPDDVNRALAEQICRVESVSLHIRRGDYVTNLTTQRVHGLCSLEYYRSAIRRLVEQVPQPQFFVFSDDPDWARENLRLGYPATFIAHNGADKHYEDLRLMSQCRHHIIANSTFSWWGAWLCANPDKMVLAPRRWFNDLEYDIHDIIPKAWRLV